MIRTFPYDKLCIAHGWLMSILILIILDKLYPRILLGVHPMLCPLLLLADEQNPLYMYG